MHVYGRISRIHFVHARAKITTTVRGRQHFPRLRHRHIVRFPLYLICRFFSSKVFFVGVTVLTRVLHPFVVRINGSTSVFHVIPYLYGRHPVSVFVLYHVIVSISGGVGAICVRRGVVEAIPPVNVFATRVSGYRSRVTFVLFFWFLRRVLYGNGHHLVIRRFRAVCIF